MANFKKVFNFREGLQASDQSLVVNGSLVGIGTSIPTKFLDVRSEASFSGLSTFAEVRVSGGASFETGVGKSVILGNFSVNDGIITSFTGVVSYFGDGSQLANLPTSQWVDVDTGIGVSSVYNGGNVGISTLIPQYQLQVGGNPEQGGIGIGMNYGNIYVSAAITATKFLGNGTFLTDLDADELTSGIVTQARIPRLELDKLPLVPDFKLVQDQQLSGIVTALGGFIGSITPEPGRSSEARIFANTVIESGISTFNEGEFKGTLTAVASTARTLTGTPDIRVGFVSANTVDAGIAFTVNRADIYGDLNVGKIVITDTTDSFKVGTSGSIFNITDGGVGIGTTDPSSTLVLYQAEGSNLEILTESGAATLNLGGDLGIGNSTAELRQEGLTLQLSNYSNGDYIYHLGRGLANSVLNGNFRWVRGDGAEERMTLTKAGNLGIGITNPTERLNVNGNTLLGAALTVTSTAQFNDDVHIYGSIIFNNDSNAGVSTAFKLDILNDFNVSGNSVFTGTVDLPENVTIANNSGVSTFATLDVTTALNLIGIDDFNVNTTNGISTFNDISITGTASFTNAISNNINVSSGVSTVFDLNVGGNIGVSGTITANDFVCNVEDASIGMSTFIGLQVKENLTVDEGVIVGASASIAADLFVAGVSTFEGAVNIGGDVDIVSTSGVATFFGIDATNSIVSAAASFPIIEGDVEIGDQLTVGSVGAGYTFNGSSLDAVGGAVIRIGRFRAGVSTLGQDTGSIGFATDFPCAAIDVGLRTDSYIRPPVATTADRDYNLSITGRVKEGALIYNTTLKRLEFFNGTGWVGVATVA